MCLAAHALEFQSGSVKLCTSLRQSRGISQWIKTIKAVGCIEIIRLEPSEQLTSLQLILEPGKAEAITLALERQFPILIDERKGRTIALQKNLILTGFAGLLLLAVKRHVLPPTTAQSLLDQAIRNGFRMSDKLYRQVSTAYQAG